MLHSAIVERIACAAVLFHAASENANHLHWYLFAMVDHYQMKMIRINLTITICIGRRGGLVAKGREFDRVGANYQGRARGGEAQSYPRPYLNLDSYPHR